MRIRGQGPGYSDSRGSREGEPARVKRLRSKLRVGLQVDGLVVSKREDGLYWVEIEDTHIIAALNEHCEIGSRLLFLVERLEPEITLRLAPQTDTLRRLSRMV